jgi:siroheme synthase
VIRWGTTEVQQSVKLTLDAAAQLEGAPLPPPVVVVIGDVVRLGPLLQQVSAPLHADAVDRADTRV